MKRSLLIALCAGAVLVALQPLRQWLANTTAQAGHGADAHALHSGQDAGIDIGLYNALLPDACQRQRDCDQPARLLDGRTPRYPAQALAQGRNGHAVMRFAIRSDGSTEANEVVSSSEPLFAQAAGEAIAGWRLQPARFQGRTQPQAMIHLAFAISP